jgi:hypothetical protein
MSERQEKDERKVERRRERVRGGRKGRGRDIDRGKREGDRRIEIDRGGPGGERKEKIIF